MCPKVKEGALNIHLIAHSHVDVGWTHTVDEFYTGAAVGTSCTKCILELTIKELAKNPERRYIFIEMKYFSRFWQEIDEKDKDLIRKLIKERRLELVGGGWVMSDAGVTMYNDIIDQHTLGFDFIADTLGTCAQARTAWHVDLFGYSREHASILSQMGYDSLFIGRIDFMDMEQRKKTKNMEFLWNTSPNNLKNKSALFTNILYEGYYAPPGYTMDKFSVAPEVTQPIVDSFVNLIKKWSVSFKSNHVVVAMGADFAYRNAETWFNFYDPLIKKANEMYPDIHLMYSTPSCYSYYVNKERVTLEEKKEDFHPYSIPPAAYWTGFYTTRGGLKRHIKQAGQILQSCKQLSIFTDLQDSFQDVNVLRDAMGVMQHHDAITGTQRAHVHRDYNRILSQATSVCEVGTFWWHHSCLAVIVLCPSTDVIVLCPSTDVIVLCPSTDVIVLCPSTDVIVLCPSTDVIVLCPSTDVIVLCPIFKAIVLDPRHDVVVLGLSPDVIVLGLSPDVIVLGLSPDVIVLGLSPDVVVLGLSPDVVVLGLSPDVIVLGLSPDVVVLGLSPDVVVLGLSPDVIVLGLSPDVVVLGLSPDVIVLGLSPDVIVLGLSPDVVVLGLSPDVVVLGLSPDVIVLGLSPDVIVLGLSPDVVVLGLSPDVVVLGLSPDVVVLGRSPDVIVLGPSPDVVVLGLSPDVIVLGLSPDVVVLGLSPDVIVLGLSPDVVVLGLSPDVVVLGLSPDVVVLGLSPDVVVLGLSPDVIVLGLSPDVVVLGLSPDVIVLGPNHDVIALGPITDVIVIGPSPDVIV
ncbi:lysosomal alpha-mannosidase [Biomphalaria glabrata]